MFSRTHRRAPSTIINLLARRTPAPVIDLPGIESRRIAEVVLLPPPNGVTPGKGVHDADSAWLDNVTAIDELRSKRRTCHQCQYSAAKWSIRVGGSQVDICEGCRVDRGVFGGVHGGDGAA